MGSWMRIADALVLSIVFLLQALVLDIFIIGAASQSPLPFFWFLADFGMLLLFIFTIYVVGKVLEGRKKKRCRKGTQTVVMVMEGRSDDKGSLEEAIAIAGSCNGNGNGTRESSSRPCSRQSTTNTSEYNFPENLECCKRLSRNYPLAYASWMVYSLLTIVKIWVLIKWGVPQSLKKDDFLGPQMFKLSIGASTIVFSCLVAAHKDSRLDKMTNALLNSLCFQVALEILDSASFLSLLMPEESHLMYSFQFENLILLLVSMNLLLPTFTLYGMCATEFGRHTNFPYESVYKFIHLVLINGSFMCVRVYLWGMYSTDTSIFLIKNIYAFVNFMHGVSSDVRELQRLPFVQKWQWGRKDKKENNSGSDIHLNCVNNVDPVTCDSLPFTDRVHFDWPRHRENSISNTGIHGSADGSNAIIGHEMLSLDSMSHAGDRVNGPIDRSEIPSDDNFPPQGLHIPGEEKKD